ncbi:MAG: glycosyltransferase family 39 protein, partial [Anaerolineae bacterium]
MRWNALRQGDVFTLGIRRQARVIMVLIAYVVLSVLMTWPLAAQLGTLLPAGAGGDVWTHQWTFWWVKKAIAEGHNPFYTDLIFYPNGVSLTSHNIAWLNIAAWLPLQAIVGSNAAYSLIFIGIFALNGLAMYLLAREWTGSSVAAFIGGLVYGFWPYTLSQSGHPNMIVVCWVPLALLYLRRTLDKGRWQDAVLVGVFVALTGVARWQLLVMGGVVIGLYVVYRCLTEEASRRWRTLGLL